MQTFYMILALFLLVLIAVGMYRVIRGPGMADRMLAAQLFSTTAVAVLLLISQALAISTLRDVALVLALLAAITAVAFVRIAWAADAVESNDK